MFICIANGNYCGIGKTLKEAHANCYNNNDEEYVDDCQFYVLGDELSVEIQYFQKQVIKNITQSVIKSTK